MDRRSEAASAVMQKLKGSIVLKRELSQKAKLSIYRSIYIPTFTYGHEFWVMTKKMRSQIQVAENKRCFLCRVAELNLKDRVSRSDI